ncbi:MAG: multiheme c-type cytochrome [Candidatus Methanoperedens sp.]|nr:multiheme c-type cytochrome [Candidatus Methanoperedens sp.]
MKNRILLGIGILIILLALAGTGSAKSAYSAAGADCGVCHTSIVDGNYTLTAEGSYFRDVHKFNGNTVPSSASSCLTCHPDLTSFLPLTSVGSSYNQTHRYNAATLAAKMLPVPGCANCHVNAIGNNFSFITGAPTYLTSSVCQDCHPAKYNNWANTTHAHMLTPAAKAQTMGLPTPPGYSWSDISYVLVTKFQLSYINATGYWLAQNNTYNTETQAWANGETAGGKYTCASCHTTGYSATGVNSLPGITGTFTETGIACERCHGPAGNGHQVTVNYSGTLCTECHSGSHHGTGWENSAHAPPALQNRTSCTKCHSPFDNYLNNTPTLAKATDVSCGVCHNTHDITDMKYADTFSKGIFNQTAWSKPANAKLSFFNATASIAAKTDVFDDLAIQVLIIPGSSSLLGPMNLTGKPVSEVLCSKCHFNHGLDHMKGVPLSHGKPGEWATCTDCHMSGANATVGRDMMANHAMNPKTSSSCLPCHKTNPAIIREWTATAHNDKQVAVGTGGLGPNHFYGTLNTTTGIANAQPNMCLKCKDPMHFNPAIAENVTTKINLTDSFRGITCAVCHNIHDMADWLNNTKAVYGVSKPYAWYNVTTKNYTMMANTTELCGHCHVNTRYGNTGPGWVAGAANPIGAHGLPAADMFEGSWKQTGFLKFECTSCHFAKQTRNFTTGASLTADERIGGHSFKVNTTILMNGTACSSCHVTGSTLGNLSYTINKVKTDTQAKWNTTNATVMAALATVKAYTGEKSMSRDQIAQAYWNIKLFTSGGATSWGVHNPTKANDLLDQASALATSAVQNLGVASSSSVQLYAGWNLVSLNATPASTSPISVMSSVSSNLTIVWGLNAATQTWVMYNPARPVDMNTLTSMAKGVSYEIKVANNCMWTV